MNIYSIKIDSLIEKYADLSEWFLQIAKEWNLDSNLINKITICSEEIFVNIASYAYGDKVGKMEISIEKNKEEITLQFKDFGVSFNPLSKDDPDINLSYEERPIGGLGIFMIKNIANRVHYERKDDKNIITLSFEIDSSLS